MMAVSPGPRRFVFEYVQAALVAVIFALFVRTFLVQPFKIPSPSMEDSLLVGDHILVNKFALSPLASRLERAFLPFAGIRRGEVVVFRPPHDPEQDYIKRVIGLPGETLKIVNRVVYVRPRGEEGYIPLLEPYSSHRDPGGVPPQLDNLDPVEVPAGQYFVMGDNRDNSLDSREWGMLPRAGIFGRGLLVYWSFDGVEPNGVRAATRSDTGPARRLWDGASAVFRHTRWSRTFRLIR
jgi:signal peptidase I